MIQVSHISFIQDTITTHIVDNKMELIHYIHTFLFGTFILSLLRERYDPLKGAIMRSSRSYDGIRNGILVLMLQPRDKMVPTSVDMIKITILPCC